MKIIKSMNKDWIVVGRKPQGLCAAAIIIAARIENKEC